MNLNTGSLLWMDTLLCPPNYPILEEDILCDVLVIGSGVSGSLVAYHLQENHVDTVVVDKRSIGRGSTSANTGLLQFGNDKELSSCIHTFGVERGVRFYQLCKEAIDHLETITQDLEISPDFIRRDSLYYASSNEDIIKLEKEYRMLKSNGFDVSYFSREEINHNFSFTKPGAIYARGDAEVNPYKMTHGLLNASYKQGMRVYQETEIVSHALEGQDLVFFTKNRQRIRAKTAVFATGYETQSFNKHPNAVLTSTYAIATQPIASFNGWLNRCLIWETARPYFYFRTTADNRIVVGGLDENTVLAEARDAHLLRKRDLLVQATQELFPNIPDLRADYFWSATFGGTHDGYPLIGTQEAFPNCYFSLGYGGNGTVYSAIAAQIITDLITRGYHPDAGLFGFDRSEQNDHTGDTPKHL